MGDSQVGLETQRFGEFDGGFDESVLLCESFTEPVMRLPKCRAKTQCRFELEDRFIEPVLAREKVSQIAARIGGPGIRAHRGLIMFACQVQAALMCQSISQIVMSWGI